MFEPVNSRINLPQLEAKVLKLWQAKDVFKRSVAIREGGPEFVLFEGPPTANGRPGIHHVLARVFKDVIPRYRTMKGDHVPRRAGWDTHGLPVELEVENKLGFSSKTDIERFGIAEFNAKCRESVFTYLKDWEEMTERIAYWTDMENAYITMDNAYMETIWWAIKQMWDKGLIYQGYRVTPHCPRCGTSLSSHEVALGYQDNIEDPSIYVKFLTNQSIALGKRDTEVNERLLSIAQKNWGRIYFLAWTTTPWTLPGNTALAVNPDVKYALVDVVGEILILADALRGQAGLGDYEVVERVKGSHLVGAEYEPLYNPHEYGVKRESLYGKPYLENTQVNVELRAQEVPEPAPLTGHGLTYKVIEADFVSMEDGTGIVHVAPAYGEVDYQAMLDDLLDFVHHVDLGGKITGTLPGAGKFVKDADKDILEDLKSRGLLHRSETIRHTYPFCWRCEAPLLYYAKQTWYIRTTAVKDALIRGNNEINWYPEHIKYGRFGDWLANNVDWAFSRERYWGTPLPVWRCEACSAYECLGGVAELEAKPGFSGFKEPLDLHRPFVDEVTFACAACGGTMKRLPEVIDCWFDSGAMPIAQWHYPFENDTLLSDGRFPADYICEAVDQTRGWFYSLHAISTLLFGRPCFKNVICLGHILDAQGEKMSKTRGNVVEPGEIISQYGADALRWYCLTSTPPGNVRRFSKEAVSEVSRRFLMTLWNIYSFFVTYANIDRFVPGAESSPPEEPELDRWIASELNQLITEVDRALESYNPTEAGRKIEAFVDSLSNWYVRRSRRRFWKSENDADKLSAYHTLYQCLVALAKLMAPLTPFIAEALYQNLVCSVSPDAPDSVHLTEFPVADISKIDEPLSAATRLAIKVSSLGRAARSQAGIKVRQPLARVIVRVPKREQEGLKQLAAQMLEELNVKSLEFAEKPEELEKPGYVTAAEDECTVAIPTEISLDLRAEGMAREIVHRLQNMRRAAGFDIADHITTYYQGDDYIRQVMAEFAGYIRQETLSKGLIEGIPETGVFAETYTLSDYDVRLGIKKEV